MPCSPFVSPYVREYYLKVLMGKKKNSEAECDGLKGG